ncbi:pilus assembly/adherence protein PilC [Neisseria meningitidis]|nr:pilus assembly/adherence protein PilC [Neisseria meningitidis]MBH5565102.1 pilus assembly/adherence protein PilC [Neisseria meningitidis]MBH5622416.1 pilus assembly/adherence protein PilC [Neisseria meningitidis]MBH5632150.1 pilus assembly/adherence protein PilC [Neisseria meningitidis]MBH5633887.1 pilus assembly/adherence protein PilC [Neisseria meningitidis]
MNKTLKRQVFRHTALYAAILMFSHTGGGGAQAETRNYAIVMNEQNQPNVKQEGSYSTLREKDRKRKFDFNANRGGGGSVFFDNTDTLVSQQRGTAVFGTATYLPPYGKVSGFDEKRLTERGNALNWINTTHPGLIGYSYAGVVCKDSTSCPKLVYKTRFSFDNTGLAKNAGSLDRHPDLSRENSPIYKLKDHPWLGVSFNLGSENTVKNGNSFNKLISSFSEDNNNQTIVSTTEGSPISLGDQQREHTAVVYYLNAKLHLLDKKQIQNITDKTVQLGTLRPRVETTGRSWLNFWATWKIEDKGNITVRLDLPEVKAGRCVNANNPNKSTKAPSPALTAPALWFGPVQNGKAEMYSASVSTYPDSSSSRIFLQNLKRKNDSNRPGRHSLETLTENDIKSRQPNFTGRQTIIRLDSGVQQIKLQGNEVANFNRNDGKNDTFGIVSEYGLTPDANEWKKVLLPWTVRAFNDDGRFNTVNKEENNGKPKYSQRYRIRENGNNGNNGKRDLGDIVNSPIVAVGEYLATSANDGMVHIFKQSGGDKRSYNLKLSYIPGTMPRKDIQNTESTLAKELRAFAEKSYVGDRYGVDGGFVLRQVELSGKKHVFMFGAMGFGGRGAYALDLTKAENGNPTAVSLFDVKHDNNGKNSNNSVQLGYTVGTPQIGKTHNGKYAAFLASGYATKTIDSTDNKTALYVYDLESSGTLIKKIDVPGGKGGLSSPTLVDKDLDGIVDIAYAGDRGGNMYRFDLSGNNPNSWTVRPIFEGTKPITSAPAISQLKDKRVVIFGTGSDLSEDDVDNKDIQHVYGIFDNDTDTGTAQDGQGKGLLEQVLSEENKTLFLTDYKRSNGSGSKGWMVKLQPRQRVTVKPTVVLRTAFVTIRKYEDNGCGAETAILGINTADGGKLTKKSARPIVPAANQAVAQYSGHKQTTKGKSIPIGCMQKGNEIVCPNGYVYDKPVNVRYLDEKKTDGFSTTADGDAGGSGIDPAGKRSGKNNRCFSQKGVRTLLMNDLDSLDITGPTCGMKRISWREVFY